MTTAIVRGMYNFVHFPRSGGFWMQHALEMTKTDVEFHRSLDPHQPPMEVLLPSYMTVREVGEWWDSWFGYHRRTNWVYFPGNEKPYSNVKAFEDACRRYRIGWEDYIRKLMIPGVTVVPMSELYDLFEFLSGKTLPQELKDLPVNRN